MYLEQLEVWRELESCLSWKSVFVFLTRIGISWIPSVGSRLAETKTENRAGKASGIHCTALTVQGDHPFLHMQSKSIISNISQWKPPISLSVGSRCRIKQSIQIYSIPFSRPGTVRIVVSLLTW